MRKGFLALAAVGACCFGWAANEASSLAELARLEDAHVIWHGDDGNAFWNAHAERFIYPPVFGLTNRADAAKYCFTVTDDLLVDHCFEAKEATAPLSPVWAEVPSNGFVRVTCRAVAADGRDLGVVGERRFWKAAGFEPGTYPPAKRSYAEAASMAFEHTLSGNVFMRHLAETGKPDRTFYFSCYPSKMHAAEIRAMIRYAKLRPDRRADAMKLARAAADYLVSVMQPADAPLAYFTPTYEKGEKHADAVNSYFGQNMLDYPASVGSAFVELADAIGERKYLDAAEKIAATYARLQGEDGTWYLKMWEKDGKPVTENRLTPMSVIVFMESLHNATGKTAYREIADRAFAFIEQRLLKDWNWEGQFEDVEPSARYRNLTKHTACSTAMYLLKRYPGDKARLAQARDLLRFAEDQFVMWTRPSRGDGRGWRTQKGPNPHNLQTDYLGWRCLPGVTEQYGWYVPIDASAAKLIRTYLALYAAEGNPLDLAKARALGDSVTRAQRDDGSIPTHWTEWSMTHGTDWLNCHLAAAQALEMLAEMQGRTPKSVGERRLPLDEFRNRMEGAWIGQSAGVAYGWPTEFKWCGSLIPDEKLPKWKPGMINETFSQDDLYVEMTFVDVLDRLGIDVSSRAAGIEFANSRYRLWCANANARNNLRNGIAAPASSHPKFHGTTDDIDYQIEADFSGILAPGLPQAAVDLGETFGRIMNYGDGLYAGQFVGAMYANAYFEDDRVKVVEQALRAIPAESRYAQMVRDMLAWHRADPKDWKGAWSKAVARYWETNTCRHVSYPNINVRVNGAMVLLGFLWGDGDMDRTMAISTAGGYDSDCNPSSACGVLGTMLGVRRLSKYVDGLDRTKKWEFTDYDYGRLLSVCERLVRKVVLRYGGRIDKDASGLETLVIPATEVRPSAFFDSADPGPVPADERLTDEERAKIRYRPCKAGDQSKAVE